MDWEGLYGSDECAMKAASHELNGLACVHGVGASVGDTRLCVPLMVLIDELGSGMSSLKLPYRLVINVLF